MRREADFMTCYTAADVSTCGAYQQVSKLQRLNQLCTDEGLQIGPIRSWLGPTSLQAAVLRRAAH
jgi:hypothetical protein